MKYINIVQRFIPLQFGEVYKESDLLEGFKDCLEKINTDGMMVLNDFSLFQAYFNDGIRSQKSNYNFIYIFIHLQFAGFVLYFVSASTNTFGNLVIIFLLLGQYGLCWTLIHLDKQNRFIYQILEWSNKKQQDRSDFLFLIADLIEDRLDEFAEAESIDNGKPYSLSEKLDIPRSIKNLEFFSKIANEAEKDIYHQEDIISHVIKQPLGRRRHDKTVYNSNLI